MAVRLVVAIWLAALGGVGTGAGSAPPLQDLAASSAGVSYRAPLAGPLHLIRAFAPPTQRYGAGHLGVDLRARQRQVVHVAADGRVAFAGPVGGRGVVVVVHPDGVRTEYEPVRPLVRARMRVHAGQSIGVIDGRHKGCAAACLHWGARRGERYLNPLDLLEPLGRVVLLPWTG
jgi:murein DD-endopeptidase MepM/ murein hydrolase activator NlpD